MLLVTSVEENTEELVKTIEKTSSGLYKKIKHCSKFSMLEEWGYVCEQTKFIARACLCTAFLGIGMERVSWKTDCAGFKFCLLPTCVTTEK